MFSLLIAFVHFTVSSHVSISPLILILFFECYHFTNFLHRDCFLSGTSFLGCCTTSAMNWRGLFLFTGIFYHFLPNCFYQAFPGTCSSALKVAEPPTQVRNTDSAHLFVWITLCSAKGIGRFYLCIKALGNTTSTFSRFWIATCIVKFFLTPGL